MKMARRLILEDAYIQDFDRHGNLAGKQQFIVADFVAGPIRKGNFCLLPEMKLTALSHQPWTFLPPFLSVEGRSFILPTASASLS